MDPMGIYIYIHICSNWWKIWSKRILHQDLSIQFSTHSTLVYYWCPTIKCMWVKPIGYQRYPPTIDGGCQFGPLKKRWPFVAQAVRVGNYYAEDQEEVLRYIAEVHLQSSHQTDSTCHRRCAEINRDSMGDLQDPKMEVLYHIRPFFERIFPYIGLI